MKPASPSNLHVILIAAALAIAPLAIYCGAYFGLSCGSGRSPSGGTCRVYRSQWVALVFIPGCLVEGAVTGRETLPAWRDPTVGPGRPPASSSPGNPGGSPPMGASKR
jgi:hypothetical protein